MTGKPPIVAVVDDEEDVRHSLQRLLRSAGFEVLVYGSGTEFLRHVTDSSPDCVVLDMHMPRLTGLDVQAELRDRRIRSSNDLLDVLQAPVLGSIRWGKPSQSRLPAPHWLLPQPSA